MKDTTITLSLSYEQANSIWQSLFDAGLAFSREAREMNYQATLSDDPAYQHFCETREQHFHDQEREAVYAHNSFKDALPYEFWVAKREEREFFAQAM